MLTTKSSEALVLVSKQNGIVVIPAGTPLTRLNYFDGKFLRAADLQAEQSYLRHLVRQSNQAGGAGVAHGFDLTLGGGDTLDIGPGLAIDPDGRVLLLPQETSVEMQELIDKSRDLQRLFGKTNVVRAGAFETCELASGTPPDNTAQSNNLFLIVISPAEALCGEEDVFGKLCEEACTTSTDRPFVVEGLVIRAIPLVLQTPLPGSKAVSVSQAHLRSRVASAYFEDERKRVASLISKFGLEQQTWCLGADALGGSGVPIGVIARAGSSTVFLDAWTARRERIDPNARRYWQWRMMMRPWDVFLAQVLQFQCQLHDLAGNFTQPGDVDPCGGAREALNDAAATITEFRRFYEATTQRFTALKVDLDDTLTFSGGLSRLSSLNTKISAVGRALGIVAQDRLLIRGGIVELPSAGYLPVIPGAAITVNQQVRQMLGEGVDLRFCVVRPDYVAHALEEAQHMERISLLQGLDDPTNKPQVDILVPNGEIVSQQRLSPGFGFEASVDVSNSLLVKSGRVIAPSLGDEIVNFRGAARAERLPSDGGAVYLSCEFQSTSTGVAGVRGVASSPAGISAAPGVAPAAAGATGSTAGATLAVVNRFSAGLWTSLSCERNVFVLQRGDTANFNGRVVVGASRGNNKPTLDIELNGVLTITDPAITTGTTRTVKGRIQSAQLTFEGVAFRDSENDPERQTLLVNLDATINLLSGSAVQILLNHRETDNQVELTANWGKQPLEVKARISSTTDGEEKAFIDAALRENSDVLAANNVNHVQALTALEVVASVLSDPAFADAKARLLFPPPPPLTDELIVRGTLDWVLFHRRRAKQCSEVETLPVPQAPPRSYELFLLRAENINDALQFKESLQSGQIPPNTLARVDVVEFGGGVAALLTPTDDLLKDWQIVNPGGLIFFGAIANRDSAAADGEVLARTRLDRLEDALAPISKLHPDAQSELLAKIPEGIPASSVDGVVFLITLPQIATTCQSILRTTGQQFENVVNEVRAGRVDNAISQFGAQLVGDVNFKSGTIEVVDNSLQVAAQKWKQFGGGVPANPTIVSSPSGNQNIPIALRIQQAMAIGQGLDPATPITTPVLAGSQVEFPDHCSIITIMAPRAATAPGRRALVIFGSFDPPTHFLNPDSPRATVEFDNNAPRGDALTNLIKGLTANQLVRGVMLGSVSGTLDPAAASRAGAVANAVIKERGAAVKSRTGPLTDGDKRELKRVGIDIAGFEDVIYLEPQG